MREIIVFAEGPSDEQFLKRVVAPSLRHLNLFLKPQTLNTSKDVKGGAVTFDRLKFNARNTLRQKPDAVLTTFIDLYALDTSFPAFDEANNGADVYMRLHTLETALANAIVEHVGCRLDRFIPHIQPHEFEGLLFSDVDALVRTVPNWSTHLNQLKKIRDSFESPEHINNGYETAPSRRLTGMMNPKYGKTMHGPLAAEHITLPTIERECRHFREWINRLRAVA